MRRPLPRAHLTDRVRMWHAVAAVLAVATLLTACEAMAADPSKRVSTLMSGLFPLLGAPVAWFFGPRLRPRVSYTVGRVFLALAVISAALSVHNWRNTPTAGAMAFHFVLIAVFAAVFFGRRDVQELLVLSGALHAAALFSSGFDAQAVLMWLLTILTTVGAGLVLSDVVQTMDALSYRDPLTGAANRRAWDLAVTEAIDEHRRHGLPLSVLLIDIDNFKAINDASGHDGGDAVLRSAVSTWRQITRVADTLARLGGDEFGLLLVGCEAEAARRLGDQLLGDLRRAADVTCSVGVATVRPGGEAALLLPSADAQLYAAKNAGRGCVRSTVVPMVGAGSTVDDRTAAT